MRPRRAAGTPKRAVGRGHPEVAGDGQLGPGAERSALDRGDGAEGGVGQAVEHLPQGHGEALVLERLQVGPGTEVPTGSRQDEDPGPAGHGGGEGVGQVPQRLPVDGVASLGPVEGDERHRTPFLDGDHAATTGAGE